MSVAPATTHREPASVSGLITAVSVAATVALMAAAPSIRHAVTTNPVEFVEFLVVALVLQVFAIPMANGGRTGMGAVGTLAAGIALGPGPGMAIAVICAIVNLARTRGLVHRAIFEAGTWALDIGAGALLYRSLTQLNHSAYVEIAAAFLAGILVAVINHVLLCSAIGLSTDTPPLEVWRERFRWARLYYLSWGPLALAAVEGHEAIGLLGLVVFMLPPGLLLISVNQYVARTREALTKETAAKEQYRAQSEDMQALFEFAGGLALRSHDRGAAVAFAEERLAHLLRANTIVIGTPEEEGTPLVTGGKSVATLRFIEGDEFDEERWDRLRPAILPHLATAIESAALVERVWRTHLETIAALSRSMEAKDYYTGGHTERVAAIAVALGRRLGLEADELDAVEIGALLHDVGKIGIPERILNKPEPLDSEEWKVMQEHPVISDHILSEVDLHPIVREIARWSHERYDGKGYPDRLAGEEIPLAARIVLVADALDALTSDRPYRPARHLLAALQEIREHTGSQFCPVVVRALDQVFHEEPHLLGVGYLRAVGA